MVLLVLLTCILHYLKFCVFYFSSLDFYCFSAETEPHEGKRKVESLWPIFRLHHQRSRYIFDLFYKRKAISRGTHNFHLFSINSCLTFVFAFDTMCYSNVTSVICYCYVIHYVPLKVHFLDICGINVILRFLVL